MPKKIRELKSLLKKAGFIYSNSHFQVLSLKSQNHGLYGLKDGAD